MTWLIVIGVFSLLIIIHEWGHFVVARRAGVRVEQFSIGFGPRLWSIRRGETEYVISAFPLGGFVKMAGEHADEGAMGKPWEYFAQPVWRRFAIVLAGPALNYLMAWMAFVAVFLLGFPAMGPTVGEVLADRPAAASGFAVGDRIVSIHGVPIDTWEDVIQQVHGLADRETRVVIERGGEPFVTTVIPEAREMTDLLGRKKTVGLIGIVPEGELVFLRYGVGDSIIEGTKKLFHMTGLTFQALAGVLTGSVAMRDSLTGPIGVFILTGEAARMGLVYLVHVIAVLSMSLAIFNVLPIPVLDGGHLFFLLLEGLRGRPISIRIQTVATQAGLAVLLMLMVVIFYMDVTKFGIQDRVVNWWRGQETRDTTPATHPAP